MLKEEVITALGTREIEILSRTEQDEIVEFVEEYFKDDVDRALLTIYGAPGTGKSFLIKNVIESVKANAKAEVFCAYLDVSDCVDQSEVYYRIALQLQKYYREIRNKNYKKASMIVSLYEWVKGINRPENKKKTEMANDVAQGIQKLVEKATEKLGGQEDKSIVESTIESVLSNVMMTMPAISTVLKAIDLVRNISQETEQREICNILRSRIELLNNQVGRQNYFLQLLKEALPEDGEKYMIVLDNFQLNRDNELGRNYTWLTKDTRLIQDINAMWVVVSRMPSRELFQEWFKYDSIMETELVGFDERLASKYLIKNCFPEENEGTYELWDGDEEQSKKKELVEAMLRVSRLNTEDANGKRYLPYLLRMIVLYYWKMKDAPGRDVTPDMFIEMDGAEEFVGYYFYKDLSDLMVNAFQILSCINVWDEVWIGIVQQKMDNHLLNARNLLMHTAPMEEIEPNGFKLHEALREALYRNKQNYIKQDVLKHLFQSFIAIYEKKEENHNAVWYELKRIQAFMEIAFAYIELDAGKQRERLKLIRRSMENIYDANKERGTVSENFIRLYSYYIDKLQSIYGIAFVRMVGSTFKDTTWEKTEDRASGEEKTYYMQCCFKLADLYTNNNESGTAERLEKLCIVFWESQMEEALENSDWYYRCWQQKIKALNSTAYDCSAEHAYEEAYKWGTQGLSEARELCDSLIDKYISEDVAQSKILYAPEECEQMVVEDDSAEMQYKLYQELVEAYKIVWKLRDSQNEAKRVLWEVITKDIQNLRGNLPWYILKNPELKLANDREERLRKEECVRYGIRTYWMRRCMYDALQMSESENIEKNAKACKKMMLKSYHNVCVYLAQNGEVEKACLLGAEVLDETQRLMEKVTPNEKASDFLNESDKENGKSLQKFLYKAEGSENGTAIFSHEDNIIEQMQYMGDFCLHMGRYTMALKWLSKVMLFRMVSLGATDSKTLDTVMRFFVAVYAKREECDDLFKLTVQYVKEHYIELEGETKVVIEKKESRATKIKYAQIKKLVKISEEGGDIKEAIPKMIATLEDEQGSTF